MNNPKDSWNIIPYQDKFKHDFIRLNTSWITEHFELEPGDLRLFEDPARILEQGGAIFFLQQESTIIGTASIFTTQHRHILELARMAVDVRYRGLGAGKVLLRHLIDYAKERQAEKLELYTNVCLKPALGLYRAAGFKEVSLDTSSYKRANIKMELSLISNGPVRWFDRTFPTNLPPNYFPDLRSRLQQFPEVLSRHFARITSVPTTATNPTNWSIQQHIGHLLLLESLWLQRFREIAAGKTIMKEADLSNNATQTGNFDGQSPCYWVTQFSRARGKTLGYLDSLTSEAYNRRSVHPRLQQSMSLIDFMYFVSEHDEHHLMAIKALNPGVSG